MTVLYCVEETFLRRDAFSDVSSLDSSAYHCLEIQPESALAVPATVYSLKVHSESRLQIRLVQVAVAAIEHLSLVFGRGIFIRNYWTRTIPTFYVVYIIYTF